MYFRLLLNIICIKLSWSENLPQPQIWSVSWLFLLSLFLLTELVTFLLSKGADPNVQDKRGRTPIMLAAELGNDPIVCLLAHSEANLRLLDVEGKSEFETKGIATYNLCVGLATLYWLNSYGISITLKLCAGSFVASVSVADGAGVGGPLLFM